MPKRGTKTMLYDRSLNIGDSEASDLTQILFLYLYSDEQTKYG